MLFNDLAASFESDGALQGSARIVGRGVERKKLRSVANPFHLSLLRAKYQVLYAIYGRHDLGAKLALSGEDPLATKHPGWALLVFVTFYTGVSLFAMAQQTRKRAFLKHGKMILATVSK